MKLSRMHASPSHYSQLLSYIVTVTESWMLHICLYQQPCRQLASWLQLVRYIMGLVSRKLSLLANYCKRKFVYSYIATCIQKQDWSWMLQYQNMYSRVESASDDPDNLDHQGHLFEGSSGSHPQTKLSGYDLDITCLLENNFGAW